MKTLFQMAIMLGVALVGSAAFVLPAQGTMLAIAEWLMEALRAGAEAAAARGRAPGTGPHGARRTRKLRPLPHRWQGLHPAAQTVGGQDRFAVTAFGQHLKHMNLLVHAGQPTAESWSGVVWLACRPSVANRHFSLNV